MEAEMFKQLCRQVKSLNESGNAFGEIYIVRNDAGNRFRFVYDNEYDHETVHREPLSRWFDNEEGEQAIAHLDTIQKHYSHKPKEHHED
jgi:hypothetical protein